MPADDVAAFLAGEPSGALCVVDDAGRLLAVPARVVDAVAGVLRVELTGTDLAPSFGDVRAGCVVADSFESYDGIRGVIARGPVARINGAAAPMVAMTVTRVVGFSFEGAGGE
jgi:hypothetical protein